MPRDVESVWLPELSAAPRVSDFFSNLVWSKCMPNDKKAIPGLPDIDTTASNSPFESGLVNATEMTVLSAVATDVNVVTLKSNMKTQKRLLVYHYDISNSLTGHIPPTCLLLSVYDFSILLDQFQKLRALTKRVGA